MFTGIIEDVGTIAAIEKKSGSWVFVIKTAFEAGTVREGDSVSVDGVCLTTTKIGNGTFGADASLETLRLTTLKDKAVGQRVNLERAMAVDGRFGGHIVTGHVDGTGVISDMRSEGDSIRITIEISSELARSIVKKGSVAIDGISLTVNDQSDNKFTINIIPYTASRTTILEKNQRDKINIETDIIGKYVDSFLKKREGKKLDIDFLSRHGFIKGE
ncbi:MAG: riboflavin synthase [Syntrophorhabdaceae bacterium]|nr:riboflavin synthase [Syntrophorhabdaceae bacterium]MDD4196507.1 riboflavin synthase [Syntrophorhabdaceae bacterium]